MTCLRCEYRERVSGSGFCSPCKTAVLNGTAPPQSGAPLIDSETLHSFRNWLQQYRSCSLVWQ